MAPDKEFVNVSSSLMLGILLLAALTSAQELSASCEQVCQSKYSDSQAESGYCERGCRLLRVIAFSNSAELTSPELVGLCSHACDGAYDGADNAPSTACKFGCVNQLSAVELRKQQMELMMRQQLRQMLMLDFINRLFYCQLISQLNEDSDSNGGVVSARVLIVSSSDSDLGVAGFESAQSEFYGRRPQLELRPLNLPGSTYSAIDDPSIHAMFILGLLLILGFACLLCQQPRTHVTVTTPQQKLSIYGDGETLCCVSDIDDPLIDVKARAAGLIAAPPHYTSHNYTGGLDKLPVNTI